MKILSSFKKWACVLLLCLMAAPTFANKNIYVNFTIGFFDANAHVYAWVWGMTTGNNQWYEVHQISGGLGYFTVPSQPTGFKMVRRSSAISLPSSNYDAAGSGAWNSTGDISVSSSQDYVTVTDWNGSTGGTKGTFGSTSGGYYICPSGLSNSVVAAGTSNYNLSANKLTGSGDAWSKAITVTGGATHSIKISAGYSTLTWGGANLLASSCTNLTCTNVSGAIQFTTASNQTSVTVHYKPSTQQIWITCDAAPQTSTPSVTAAAATAVCAHSVILHANAPSNPTSGTMTAYGFRYSTSSGITKTSGTVAKVGTSTSALYQHSLTGLSPNTKYYYVAYITVGNETYISAEQNFTTAAAASVAVSAPSTYSTTTATLSGTVYYSDETIGAHGFYYGTSSTFSESTTTKVTSSTSMPAHTARAGVTMTANITGLECGKTYYVWAYALVNGSESRSSYTSFTTKAYYVSCNWCSGSDYGSKANWQPASTGAAMTYGAMQSTATANVYRFDVHIFAGGDYQFKINDGTWTNNWGGSNINSSKTSGISLNNVDGNVHFTLSSAQDLSIYFDFSNNQIWVTLNQTLGVVTQDPTNINGAGATLNGTLSRASETFASYGFYYKEGNVSITSATGCTKVQVGTTAAPTSPLTLTNDLKGLKSSTTYSYVAYYILAGQTTPVFATTTKHFTTTSYYLVGSMNNWPNPMTNTTYRFTPTGVDDEYKMTWACSSTGDYQFKINDGHWNDASSQTHYVLGYALTGTTHNVKPSGCIGTTIVQGDGGNGTYDQGQANYKFYALKGCSYDFYFNQHDNVTWIVKTVPDGVETNSVTNITGSGATLHATAYKTGGTISEYGFYYNLTSPANTGGKKVVVGTTDLANAATFQHVLTDLEPGTYYVRAYVILNGAAKVSANEETFTLDGFYIYGQMNGDNWDWKDYLLTLTDPATHEYTYTTTLAAGVHQFKIYKNKCWTGDGCGTWDYTNRKAGDITIEQGNGSDNNCKIDLPAETRLTVHFGGTGHTGANVDKIWITFPTGIYTQPATNITKTGGTMNAKAYFTGTAGAFADEYGFYYGTTSPVSTNIRFNKVVATGNLTSGTPFAKAITGLEPNTTYYYRAYYTKNGEVFLSATEESLSTFPLVWNDTTSTSTFNSITVQGKFNPGSESVTSYGVYYGLNTPITTESTKKQVGTTASGNSAHAVTTTISGLPNHTTYYYRTYIVIGGVTYLSDQTTAVTTKTYYLSGDFDAWSPNNPLYALNAEYQVTVYNQLPGTHSFKITNGAFNDATDFDTRNTTVTYVGASSATSVENNNITYTLSAQSDVVFTLTPTATGGRYPIRVEATPHIGYRLKSTKGKDANMKTYYSNVVSHIGDTLSCFVYPTAKDGTLQFQSNTIENPNTWTNRGGNITVTDSMVMVATLEGTLPGNFYLSPMSKYLGDYYLRASFTAADRTVNWDGYTDGQFAFTAFSPNSNMPNEFYNHFFCAYIYDKNGNVKNNTTAKVANDFNPDLANQLTGVDMPRSLSTRYSYNDLNNDFRYAFLDGSADNTNFLTLYDGVNTYESDGADETKATFNGFTDMSNWVYSKTIYAKPGSSIKLKAQANNTACDDANFIGNAVTLIGTGSSNELYHIELVYDFKMNRLLAAWNPVDAGTITTDKVIKTDIMIERTDDGQATQISIASGKTVTQLERVQFHFHITKNDYDSRIKDGDFTYYWFSIPFDCKVSDVISPAGEYGDSWVIQRYRGDKRAELGWQTHIPTFWQNVGFNKTLNANEGYVLVLRNSRLKSKWHDIGGKYLLTWYFLSDTEGYTFALKPAVDQVLPEMRCNVEGYTLQADGSWKMAPRADIDSDWRVIGPQTFFDAQITSTAPAQPQDEHYSYLSPDCLNWVYKNNGKHNDYLVEASQNHAFKSFYSYLVQYHGTAHFGAKVQAQPSQIQARRLPQSGEEHKYCLQLTPSQTTTLHDQTFVTVTADGSSNYEVNRDLQKIFNDSRNNLYTKSGVVCLAANDLGVEETTVLLCLKMAVAGEYAIALKEPAHLVLYDVYENVHHDLNNGAYIFYADEGITEDRFELLIERAPEVVTAVENMSLSDRVTLIGHDIFISGNPQSVRLFDVVGKLIEEVPASQASEVQISVPQMGAYVLNVDGESQKIVIAY